MNLEMPDVSQADSNSQQSDMMVQNQSGFNADTINSSLVSILLEIFYVTTYAIPHVYVISTLF